MTRLLTPSRIAMLIVTALALAAVGARLFGHGQDAAPPPSVTQQQLDPAQAERTAERFVGVWCDLGDRTPEQWVAEMRAMSTPETRDQWSVNLVGNLTGDCFWGNTAPRSLSATEAVERVDTKRGRPVYVTVRQVGSQLLVAGIDDIDPVNGPASEGDV